VKGPYLVSTLLVSASFLTTRGWGQSYETRSVETRSVAGRFVVRAPVLLDERPTTTDTGYHDFGGAVHDKKFVYLIFYRDLPTTTAAVLAAFPDSLHLFLEGVGASFASQGRLISSSEISVDGHPGREILYEEQVKGDVKVRRGRVCVAYNRLYALVHEWHKGDEDENGAAFLQSFRFVESTTAQTPPEQFRALINQVTEGHFDLAQGQFLVGGAKEGGPDWKPARQQLSGWEGCTVSDLGVRREVHNFAYACHRYLSATEEAATKTDYQQLKAILRETLTTGWEFEEGQPEPGHEFLTATQGGRTVKLRWDHRNGQPYLYLFAAGPAGPTLPPEQAAPISPMPATADPFTSLHATVDGPLRFYESKGINPTDMRSYSTHFDSTTARRIMYEVRLNFAAPGSRVELPVSCTYFRPSGGVLTVVDYTFTIEPTWPGGWLTWGWGGDAPGTWPRGTYRVECTSAGRVIAQGTFEIL
jgi:hypothetical protein